MVKNWDIWLGVMVLFILTVVGIGITVSIVNNPEFNEKDLEKIEPLIPSYNPYMFGVIGVIAFVAMVVLYFIGQDNNNDEEEELDG